tara:strand:- start:417 stop:959 length:543 start_codon:yes stop_codon:yes gene_type:complete
MPKGILLLNGLDDAIADFDRIVSDIDVESTLALKESLDPIKNRMKANARTYLSKTESTETLINSIGFNVGKPKEGIISASVGVYIDKQYKYPKTSGQNRTYSAPMVAFFHEVGVRPHSTVASHRLAHKSPNGNRKQAGNNTSTGIHGGLPAQPFLTNAFDSMSENIIETIAKRLNNSIKG